MECRVWALRRKGWVTCQHYEWCQQHPDQLKCEALLDWEAAGTPMPAVGYADISSKRACWAERREQMLVFLKRNDLVTLVGVSNRLGVTTDTARKWLYKLEEEGFVTCWRSHLLPNLSGSLGKQNPD